MQFRARQLFRWPCEYRTFRANFASGACQAKALDCSFDGMGRTEADKHKTYASVAPGHVLKIAETSRLCRGQLAPGEKSASVQNGLDKVGMAITRENEHGLEIAVWRDAR